MIICFFKNKFKFLKYINIKEIKNFVSFLITKSKNNFIYVKNNMEFLLSFNK